MTNEEAIKILRRRFCEPNTCFGILCEDCVITKATQALEKQTPKQVSFDYDGYADGYPVYDIAYCPSCDCSFEDNDINWGCNYCPNCGQRLDWSEEDDER